MKILLALMISALCVVGNVIPAWAGYWRLEGYEYNLSKLNDDQVYGNSHYGPTYGINAFERYKTPEARSEFQRVSGDGEAFGAGSQITMRKAAHYGGLGEGPFRYFAGSTYVKLTITPVFRWEPNRIYNDPENYEGTPDPNDTPPKKLWYYEESNVSATRAFYMPYGNERYIYSDANPHKGHHFSIEEVSNGLGNEAVALQFGYNGTLNKSFGSHVVTKDADGSTVRGETRRLVAKVATTSAALNSTDRGDNWVANCYVSYTADIVTFDLMSRIKGDHDSTDLDTDLRPTYYNPALSASIAAGGFVTEQHEHEADIVMQVKRRGGNWGYGTPLPDVPRNILPRLRIGNREGVEKPAESEEQSGKTDGGGRVLSDVLTSRDLETHYGEGGQMGVSLGSAQSNWNPITMGRGQVEWRMGENGDKPWNSQFFLLNSNYTEWLWAKMNYLDDKPLKGHTMKFVPERVVVRVGPYTTKIFTTNLQEAERYQGDLDVQVFYQDDISDLVGDYLVLPGESEADEQGVYKAQLTVRYGSEFTVQSYQLALEDQGVYETIYR